MPHVADNLTGRQSPAADPARDVADLRATLAGDQAAFGRLVERHQAAIAAYMWRFTRDPRACEELVHDVFVEAYLSLASFRGRSPWLHWLKRIATRVGYRYWRRRADPREQAATPAALELAARADAPAGQEAAEAAELVHATLARLPPRDRLVLTLMYLEQCSVEQVVDLTGWTATMVKVQAFRARGKLKRLLTADE